MVALRADQERVRTLIKETITLLCKNGLTFDAHFSIEALIGVTLDDKDVFLVNINELVKSDKALAAATAQDEQSDELSEHDDNGSVDGSNNRNKRTLTSPSRKWKRRKRSIKTEHGQDGDSGSDNTDYSADDSNSQIPAESKNVQNIKRESPDDSENEENNVIIIKEEMEDSWQDSGTQDDSSFGQFANLPGTSQDQNFASLSDMSLMPVSSQDASQVWSQSAAYVTPVGTGRGMQRTPSVSGLQQQLDPSQEAGLEEDGQDNTIHYPSRLPPTEKKLQPRRRCRRCYRSGIRKESPFICVTCPEQPALCISPCFSDYHSAKKCPTPIISLTGGDASFQDPNLSGDGQLDAQGPVTDNFVSTLLQRSTFQQRSVGDEDMSLLPCKATVQSHLVERSVGNNALPQCTIEKQARKETHPFTQ